MAKQVGDHELSHATFEGGSSGGGPGTVIVWDTGTLQNLTCKLGRKIPLAEAVGAGHLKVELTGHRLRGAFALTRTSLNDDLKNWILVKVNDAGADRQHKPEAAELTSVLSGRTNKDFEQR